MASVTQRAKLTARHFTARNALALGGSIPLSGYRTPEQPWGQGTGWLPDGTPVCRGTFLSAVLRKYAREPGAVKAAIAAWDADVAKVGGAVKRAEVGRG